METHSSILAWRISWTESLVGYILWGHKELDMTEQLTLFTFSLKPIILMVIVTIEGYRLKPDKGSEAVGRV